MRNLENGSAYLPQLVCPYCHAKLIKRKKWLLCRYHKIGFEILKPGVNFRWDQAFREYEEKSDFDIGVF